jgi:signal transduction histidine kinase/CheY-like chemotaxis protein
MKLVRKSSSGATELKTIKLTAAKPASLPAWKVLIVDDEADVHTMTELGLRNFEFDKRPLMLLHANSAAQAREILINEPNIAVALIDVVMETDDAGLKLIDFIRNELNYLLIRLVIRTGQPGMAPEKFIIEHYDIDDYKNKTELRADKLYLMMRVTLKSYKELLTLDANRKALRRILEAVPKFHHAQSLTQFFNGVLTQLIGLCNLGENSLICGVDSGLVITTSDGYQTQLAVQSGTGRFSPNTDSPEIEKIRNICAKRAQGQVQTDELPPGALLIPLEVNGNPMGFVYLEKAGQLSESDLDLIHIMVQQCSSALENLHLYMDLQAANQKTLKMLELAEQAREEAELARRQAEIASKAKSQFLAHMSHELHTPLNAVIGYSEILLESMDELGFVPSINCLDDIKHIHTAGISLLNMVDSVLDLSEIETGKLNLHVEKFLLADLIHEINDIIQPITQEKHNKFTVNLAANISYIHTDKLRLRKMLLALLTNATKYTERGIITLNVELVDEQVEFKIIDNGLGMTSEQQSKLFQAFTQGDDGFTRKHDGMGLGLAITYRMANLMGGKLTLTSEFQHGSTFTLYLPLEFQALGSRSC